MCLCACVCKLKYNKVKTLTEFPVETEDICITRRTNASPTDVFIVILKTINVHFLYEVIHIKDENVIFIWSLLPRPRKVY